MPGHSIYYHYNQGLFNMVNLHRHDESCNTLHNLASRICLPNKTEDVNLNTFNMITKINESKTLPKHISCNC